MEIIEKLREMPAKKRMTAATVFCGLLGLLLILLSSCTDSKQPEMALNTDVSALSRAEDYREDTERRLAEFLGSIDGAGEVRVYLTVGSGDRYVYASEGRRITSENRSEEERKYVMTGSGNEKNALVETVENPEICGAVIVCTGGDSAEVRERMYRAAAAALGLPTNKIYVTRKK